MIRDERVPEEAAQWFAIMRRGATTLEERRAFDRWRADAVNQRALDSMHELWGELAVLRSRPAPIRRHRPDRRAHADPAAPRSVAGPLCNVARP